MSLVVKSTGLFFVAKFKTNGTIIEKISFIRRKTMKKKIILLVALLLAGCVIVGGISLGLWEVLRDIWRKDNTTNSNS